MKVSALSDNIYFGHSFRVSICLKDESTGRPEFVNPAGDKKLYKQLNSQIVNLLNKPHYENIRNAYGIKRKTAQQSLSAVQKSLIEELEEIDKDYKDFKFVRSVYPKGQLAYIATGADVAVIEDTKGAKFIGTAKSDSIMNYGHSRGSFAKDIIKAVNNNILEYVKSPNILLRSPDNKEIMLKINFKQSGKNKYEIDSYEFHENKSKPNLPDVDPEFLRFKYGKKVKQWIQYTVQRHVNTILNN